VGTSTSSAAHGIDIGANYSRPLSATRRAVFGFTFGSSAISALQTAIPGQERLYRAHGNVLVAYQFNKKWQARANYRRELQYVPELAEPVFTGGFSGAIDALLTPRMDFMATAGYSSGSSALSRGAAAATLETYTANVRWRFALTRTLAVYSEYIYYFYEFDARTPLTATVPPGLERNGVRVGLNVLVPMLRR
jgi:hypothetical protein